VPGPYQYAIWVICSILELTVVVCALAKHSFRRYFLLNLYMAASLLADISRCWFLLHYGFTSQEYRFAYFYSDAVLTICLYLALLQLYSHVFDEMNAERYLRIGATLLLVGTTLFSYLVVHQSTDKMASPFVYEVSQNLYFVGMVLTYVLWGAVFKLRETRAQLIQLVLSLGVYFSAFAANYALQNLHHLHGLLSYVTPLTGIWLPAAWCYAFLRTPEDARLAPSQLALSRR